MSEENIVGTIPSYLSPDWHQYVMEQFSPEELADGNPTTAGLRRVAELLLGPIVYSGVTRAWPVDGNLAGRATVLYEIRFVWRVGVPDNTISLEQRTFTDIADTYSGNADMLFASYAVATASTRAEGRTLRKALKLRGIAAEELATIDAAKGAAESVPDAIGKEQVQFIDQRCKKLDINIVSFINYEPSTNIVGTSYRGIYDVNKSQAASFIQELNVLTNDKPKIPEIIKGYVEWKEKVKKS